MSISLTDDTKATLSRHLEAAAAKNLDAILEDYGDESVLYTLDGTFRGLDEIRGFFTEFLYQFDLTAPCMTVVLDKLSKGSLIYDSIRWNRY
jgi:hypothetical protein